MKISALEKEILMAALETEKAKCARAVNATRNPAIKELLKTQVDGVQAMQVKVANEVVA